MAPNTLLVLTSDQVLLDTSEAPSPATIEVDLASGKIVAVHKGRRDRGEHYADLSDEFWVDAGDLFLLPGLVE